MIELKRNIIPELVAILSSIYTFEIIIFLIFLILPAANVETVLFLSSFSLFFLLFAIPVIVENKHSGKIYRVSHNKIEIQTCYHVGHEITVHKKLKKIKRLESSSYIIDESKKLIYERKNIRYLILFFSGLLGIYTFMGYSGNEIPGFGIINSLYIEYYYKEVKQKNFLGCFSKKTIQKIKELIPNLIIK